MAKKKLSHGKLGSNEKPFSSPSRPNNDWAYEGGMVPENPKEFGSAPAKEDICRYPHMPFGVAGMGAHLEDGPSGMDRHVGYVVFAGKNNLFED